MEPTATITGDLHNYPASSPLQISSSKEIHATYTLRTIAYVHFLPVA